MLHYLAKRLGRMLVLLGTLVLVAESARRLERRRRGKEEWRKLRRADLVVVSYGKSGRTWLRVLLSRFFQLRCGLNQTRLIGFGGARHDPRLPRVFFTHDNYLRDYTGHLDSKQDFYDRKLVLLVRHPADVAVSQYFQWKFRMRPRKKSLNRYPAHGAEVGLAEFMADGDAGLPKVIEFLNGWSRELPRLRDVLVVRYEDLRADTAGELARVLRLMGQEPTPAELADCVAFARIENMRQLEASGSVRGSKVRTRSPDNPNASKIRRAKVGGWRDDVDTEQATGIERVIEEHLLPGFGYLAREQVAIQGARVEG